MESFTIKVFRDDPIWSTTKYRGPDFPALPFKHWELPNADYARLYVGAWTWEGDDVDECAAVAWAEAKHPGLILVY